MYLSDQSKNKDRRVIYLFTGSLTKLQHYKTSIKILQRLKLMNAVALISKYAKAIASLYNISIDEFANKAQLIILKYLPNAGMWVHIDNIERYDQGPIITINVGPKYAYYDMIPVLLPSMDDTNVRPLRIKIPQGNVLIMDGISRIEWAHGLPYNVPYEKTKYTLMFKCDKFSTHKVLDHNRTLDLNVISSGKVCNS
jgi:alkylated DNA repair dioxygenase AlkB